MKKTELGSIITPDGIIGPFHSGNTTPIGAVRAIVNGEEKVCVVYDYTPCEMRNEIRTPDQTNSDRDIPMSDL